MFGNKALGRDLFAGLTPIEVIVHELRNPSSGIETAGGVGRIHANDSGVEELRVRP